MGYWWGYCPCGDSNSSTTAVSKVIIKSTDELLPMAPVHPLKQSPTHLFNSVTVNESIFSQVKGREGVRSPAKHNTSSCCPLPRDRTRDDRGTLEPFTNVDSGS